MRKASLSRMPMTIAWALSHSLLRRRERTLRCWSVDRIMKAAAEGRARRQRSGSPLQESSTRSPNS